MRKAAPSLRDMCTMHQRADVRCVSLRDLCTSALNSHALARIRVRRNGSAALLPDMLAAHKGCRKPLGMAVLRALQTRRKLMR